MTEAPDDVVAALRAAGCVFAEDEARLILATARTSEELASMVKRRAAGEPLEQVVGWAEFCGLRIAVEAGVFVPRRRTEFLARQAVARATPGTIAVELCCGAGAIGAVLLAEVAGIELHAADIDPVATHCARGNLGARARVYTGNLFEPLPVSLCGRVGVLVANVPYVPSDEIEFLPSEAKDHEPRWTLDGGPDGLDVLRGVAAGASTWLAPGGTVLFETSERQVALAAKTLATAGLTAHVATAAETEASVVLGIAASPGSASA